MIGSDERGVSITVTHVLTFAITSALITALLMSAGGLLNGQQKDAARRQLTDIGGTMSSEIRAVERLDDTTSTTRVNVAVEPEFPSTVAGGTAYTVALLRDGDGDSTLFLNATTHDLRLSFAVPLDGKTVVENSRTKPGNMTIYNCWNDDEDEQTLTLTDGDC